MTLVNLLRYISLKRLKLHKAQTFMAVCGISLGVAAIVSIGVVSQSVVRSFEDSVTKIGGRASLQVMGPESGFPETFLDRVQAVNGVEYAMPVIEVQASLGDGNERSLTILGVDVLQDNHMRDYSVSDESAEIPDPLLFLAKPDSILITGAMAKREGIRLDQDVTVEAVNGMRKLRVRGLLNPEGPASAVAGNIAVMDLYAAQMTFGKEGRIDRIDVSLIRGEETEIIRERVKAALPEGYTVDTAAGRTRRFDDILSSFRKFINTIALVSVFAGMYLIYNAVSIAAVQRRKEIGILRAVGAERRQIVSMFMMETLMISLAGSFLGVAMGVFFAALSLSSFSQSMSQLYQYAYSSSTTLHYSWHYPAAGVCIGVVSGLIAALAPARSAARIAPVSAIRSVPDPEGGWSRNRKLAFFSALCLIITCGLTGVFTVIRYPGRNYVFGIVLCAEFLLLLGITLAMPFVLRGFTALFHRFASLRLGASARLAGLNIRKNINRNAVASGAVFIGLALFAAISNIVLSMQEATMKWINIQTSYDLLVTMGHPFTGLSAKSVPMPSGIRTEIDRIPGVALTDVYRNIFVPFKGSRVLLESVDMRSRLDRASFIVAHGDLKTIARVLPGQDNVIVSESLAARHDLKPGDSISLPTPAGPVQFGVAGVIVDYSYEYGAVLMDSTSYQRHWKDGLLDGIAVTVSKKDDIQSVRAAILATLDGKGNAYVITLDDWNQEIRRIMDRNYASFHALSAMTLSIACIGIFITLLASVLERSREIGILRSLGALKNQITRIVVVESMLLGLLGGLLGIAGGVVLGWMAIHGMVRGEAGMSVDYSVDYGAFVRAIVLSGALSALAGLYPARRAAKTNIVEALAYE